MDTRSGRVGLPNPARLVVLVVAGGGTAAVAASLLAFPPVLDGSLVKKAIVLVVLTAVAEVVAIPLKHGTESELITLYELAVVADLVLLPIPVAIVVAVTGLGVALVVLRRPPIKAAFNLGSYGLGVVAAAAIYDIVGGGDFATARGLVGIVFGMGGFTAINLLAISSILAATEGRSLARVLAEEHVLSLAMGLGNSAVGIVAVSLYTTRPVLLGAVLAPAVALHMAFREWVKEKELSRRMEDEKSKLERIVEHSAEGIVLVEADGSVALWSPSMERLTGLGAREALGKAVSFLLRGRGLHGEPVAVDIGGEVEAVDVQVARTDGEQRWLRVQHGPVLSSEGELVSDVLLVYDMTRQREVERLRDDFVATVSHELRTPLTPIKGYATLLLNRGDELPADRVREALQSIVDRSEHMHRLVEDLLLASRMGRPGERRAPPDIRDVPVDLARVTDRSLRAFRLSHPAREFSVAAAEQVVAFADPLRVEQILANLLSNAMKFSQEATPVEVAVWREGNQACLAVRDHGRGIQADKLEEIFEKFVRLEDPMTMQTSGAGLGLYIVRQLASAMGGSVEVMSTVDQGSTFTVRLPTRPLPAEARRHTDPDEKASESA
jgi:PAS domain S-box-containing protein